MTVSYSQNGKIYLLDINREYIDDVEEKYEKEFMDLLHSSMSYEEFKMKSDMALSKFDVNYLGLSSIDELDDWLKNYYMTKESVHV